MRAYKMPEGVEPVQTYDLMGEAWKPTPDIPYVRDYPICAATFALETRGYGLKLF